MAEVGERTRGEIFEGIGFQFCKVATVALICGSWTLPIASGLCAAFFLAGWVGGKRNTRCVLRSPLLAAAFYGIVCAVSVWWKLRR